MNQKPFWRSLRTALLSLFVGLTIVQGAAAQTLRMWSFLDPASGKDPREKVLKKLIDGFEAANPGVKIVTEPQIWQQMSDKFFAAHQTGTAPDIMWMHEDHVLPAVQLGAVENLDPLFAKNKLFTKEDYDDLDGAYWQFASSSGAHYHIAHSRSITGMLYRADLFRDAGIDPKSLTTWPKFVAAAQKLNAKDSAGNPTRWGFGQAFAATGGVSPPIVASVMLDRDKKLFDDAGRAVWATSAGVEGLTLETDMVTKDKVTPDTALSLNGEDIYDQFAAGRVAIIRAASARVPRMQDIMGVDKVGYMPTPSFEEGKYSPTEASGWSLQIWTGSKQKDLAAKFIAYLSTRDADRMWVMDGGAVPIRKSTITDNPAFFADPAHSYLAVIADSMVNAAWLPATELSGGWNEEMQRAAQAVLANHVDPKAALQRAQDTFNKASRL